MKNGSASNNRKAAFIGGDARMLAAAETFAAEENAECAVYGFAPNVPISETLTRTASPEDAIRGACAVVLPLPASADGLRVFAPLAEKDIYLVSVLSLLEEDQLLLGGRTDMRINEVHSKTFDYYEREELKIMNSVPTAEGAIAVAMKALDITLHGAKTAVIGFGRVGKALSLRLHALGADVCVFARNRGDTALAETMGMRGAHISELEILLKDADCVFNTVPHILLDSARLAALRPGVPVIELASAPGGADAEEAKRLGVELIPAPALPGRCAPVTAGAIIARAVAAILREEHVL